jgi:hypothetical protein
MKTVRIEVLHNSNFKMNGYFLIDFIFINSKVRPPDIRIKRVYFFKEIFKSSIINGLDNSLIFLIKSVFQDRCQVINHRSQVTKYICTCYYTYKHYNNRKSFFNRVYTSDVTNTYVRGSNVGPIKSMNIFIKI